jgi:flagellar motility protein MotE (MotC chaperone)
VQIYGDLTIEEAFDFLSFFERKGYKSVVIGEENSTLRMMKIDQKDKIIDQRVRDLKDEVANYKKWLSIEKESHEETEKKLKSVEVLLKTLMSEEREKYKKLHEENEKIIRSQMIMELKRDPKVQKIMDNFYGGYESGDTEVKVPIELTNGHHIAQNYINPDPTKE